jgi:hypothetical protein
MGEFPLPFITHLQIGGIQATIVIQLLLNLGICLFQILHGNTLLLEALQISCKFIVFHASFKLRIGTVAGFIPVIYI